jgi:hypothetical protein
MAHEAGESPSSQSTELPDVMPDRSDEVEVADFGTEFVVFDPRNRMAHHLSGWLAAVFDACDGDSSPAELAADATAYWQGNPDESRYRVGEAIRAFESLGILAGSTPLEPPPCVGCGGGRTSTRRRWQVRR